MDIPTALSIIISVAFAITGFVFSNKSDSTLSSIQATINAQQTYFTQLLSETMARNYEIMNTLIRMMEKDVKVHKGELTREDAEDFEQLSEAIRQMQKNPYVDIGSVLSTGNKVGEEHG